MPRSPWQESYREADFNGHVQPTRSFIFPRLRNPITQFILLSAISSITLFADFLSFSLSPRNLELGSKNDFMRRVKKTTGSKNYFDVIRRDRLTSSMSCDGFDVMPSTSKLVVSDQRC